MSRQKVRRTRDKHRLPPEVRTTKVDEIIREFADGCRKLLTDAFRKLAADGKPASGASDEYREVSGHPGYRVSAGGQVQSCWGSTGMSVPEEWYTIQPQLAEGRRSVRLGKRGERADCRVGKLVLLAWRGKPPPGKPHVRHVNNDLEDDRLENLEWSARKQLRLSKPR